MQTRIIAICLFCILGATLLVSQNCTKFEPTLRGALRSASHNQDNNNFPASPFNPYPPLNGEPYTGPINFTSNSENYKTLCTSNEGIAPLSICQMPSMTPPPPGGSYIDPVFGSKIRTLSVANMFHHYSFQSAFSKTSKYVVLGAEKVFSIRDTSTGQEIWNFTLNSDYGFSEFRWSRVSDPIAYHTSTDRISKIDVEKKTIETYIDLTQAPYNIADANTGKNHDSAADDWTAFFSTATKKLCLIHLPRKLGKCLTYDPSPWTQGAPLEPRDLDLNMAKNFDAETKRLYIIVTALPGSGIFSTNYDHTDFKFEFRAPEIQAEMKVDPGRSNDYDGICEVGEECVLYNSHQDTFQDSSGRQFVFPAQSAKDCKITYAAYQISKGAKMGQPIATGGGRIDINFNLNKCGGTSPWTFADHIGCATEAPYCVISAEYMDDPGQATSPFVGKANFYSELFVVKDFGKEWKRVGHYRSLYFDYWASPRPSISGDAKLILFDSNFGIKDAPRNMILETGVSP